MLAMTWSSVILFSLTAGSHARDTDCQKRPGAEDCVEAQNGMSPSLLQVKGFVQQEDAIFKEERDGDILGEGGKKAKFSHVAAAVLEYYDAAGTGKPCTSGKASCPSLLEAWKATTKNSKGRVTEEAFSRQLDAMSIDDEAFSRQLFQAGLKMMPGTKKKTLGGHCTTFMMAVASPDCPASQPDSDLEECRIDFDEAFKKASVKRVKFRKYFMKSSFGKKVTDKKKFRRYLNALWNVWQS